MKRTRTILTIILLSCLGLISVAQDAKPTGHITLKVKAYLESKHVYSDMADNLTVRVDELLNKSIKEFKKRSGRFHLDLKPNKHYIIYFSQDGFETSSLVFSTVGVDPAEKHIFHVDVMLKRMQMDESDYYNSAAAIRYDYLNSNNFIIQENDARIYHKVKSK